MTETRAKSNARAVIKMAAEIRELRATKRTERVCLCGSIVVGAPGAPCIQCGDTGPGAHLYVAFGELQNEVKRLRAENQHIRDEARREALEEAAKVAEMFDVVTLIPTHEPLRILPLRVMIAAGIRAIDRTPEAAREPSLEDQKCGTCGGKRKVRSEHPHDKVYYGHTRPCPDCTGKKAAHRTGEGR